MQVLARGAVGALHLTRLVLCKHRLWQHTESVRIAPTFMRAASDAVSAATGAQSCDLFTHVTDLVLDHLSYFLELMHITLIVCRK